jgi:hypothetical protein
MKRYEYKNLHERPLLTMGSPLEFQEWVLKTLNHWGSQGWLAISAQTPATQQGFTGDLFVLAARELPEMAPVQAMPDVLHDLVIKNFRAGEQADET